MRRPRLERALFEEGFETDEEFAEAVGCAKPTLQSWLRCDSSPSEPMKRRIAEALGMCWGADCDSVWLADVDWLLEPCDGTG